MPMTEIQLFKAKIVMKYFDLWDKNKKYDEGRNYGGEKTML